MKLERRSKATGGLALPSLERVDTPDPRRHMARLLAMFPVRPSWLRVANLCGEVAEWLKAADCKSARASVRWFESSPLHHHVELQAQIIAARAALERCRIRNPIAPNPISIIAHVAGSGTPESTVEMCAVIVPKLSPLFESQ